jgi:hexosaminidase
LARGEDQWYTESDFRDFQDFAKANAMTILPEFDAPAHSLAFVSKYTEAVSQDLKLI